MSHFAQIDGNGKVLRVIVAEQDFIDSGVLGDPSAWVQTSYDTRGGVHDKGGAPLRMNYAGPGYSYDKTLDAFIPPKPHDSWRLDERTCRWKPPVDRPPVGEWTWEEGTRSWKPHVMPVKEA